MTALNCFVACHLARVGATRRFLEDDEILTSEVIAGMLEI
jgi:hypothetical protein